MAHFRKRPVAVEAFTFDELVEHGRRSGVPLVAGMPWAFDFRGRAITHEADDRYLVPTPEGAMRMGRDDVLLVGVAGEVYPCKRAIFEATHDPAGGRPADLLRHDPLGVQPDPADRDRALLREACREALGSPDLSTQNGAVLWGPTREARCVGGPDGRGGTCGASYRVHGIIGRGFNAPPRPLAVTPERLERPLKYKVTAHAEEAALLLAGRAGYATEGSTLYAPWYCCSGCARAIILAGVARVVGLAACRDRTYSHPHADWAGDVRLGLAMLEEAGVACDWVEGPLGGCPPLRFNGGPWSP